MFKLTVHYQDESGNTVAPDDVMTGYVGDDYVTCTKSITGYVLKTRPTNATGLVNNFTQSVTCVYSDRSSITENIGASSDPNILTSSNTSNVNRPSKAHKYSIYNASTSSVEPECINFRPASKNPSVNDNNSKVLPQTGNNKTGKISLWSRFTCNSEQFNQRMVYTQTQRKLITVILKRQKYDFLIGIVLLFCLSAYSRKVK